MGEIAHIPCKLEVESPIAMGDNLGNGFLHENGTDGVVDAARRADCQTSLQQLIGLCISYEFLQ